MAEDQPSETKREKNPQKTLDREQIEPARTFYRDPGL
jgi:hypothetical protein